MKLHKDGFLDFRELSGIISVNRSGISYYDFRKMVAYNKPSPARKNTDSITIAGYNKNECSFALAFCQSPAWYKN